MVAEFSGSGIQNVSIGGGYRFYYRSGAGSSTRGGGVLAIRSFDFNNGESDNLLTIDGNGTVTIAAALSVPAGTLPSNPIVNSQIATSLSDPAGNLNTANPASTSWVRGAMSSIATAAGFLLLSEQTVILNSRHGWVVWLFSGEQYLLPQQSPITIFQPHFPMGASPF